MRRRGCFGHAAASGDRVAGEAGGERRDGQCGVDGEPRDWCPLVERLSDDRPDDGVRDEQQREEGEQRGHGVSEPVGEVADGLSHLWSPVLTASVSSMAL